LGCKDLETQFFFTSFDLLINVERTIFQNLGKYFNDLKQNRQIFKLFLSKTEFEDKNPILSFLEKFLQRFSK